MSYYESLIQDVRTLGGTPPRAIEHYLDLHTTVREATNVLPPEHVGLLGESLRTEFAKRALYLMSNGVKFDDTAVEKEFCPEAEWRLANAMAPDAVANPNYRSPVIVTNNDGEAVGIIKRYGTRGLYGLQDRPEYNIAAQCFHEVDDAVRATIAELPRAPYTHRMHAEAIISRPVRLSAFAIPLVERERLIGMHTPVEEFGALETDHEDLVELATHYLQA